MTNIDHAAEVLADWVLPGVPPEVVAQALADAGLLTPDQQIIRTRDELAALDPDTVVITDGHSDLWTVEEVAATSDPTWFLPVAVLATGDQARAAQQALEAADAVD